MGPARRNTPQALPGMAIAGLLVMATMFTRFFCAASVVWALSGCAVEPAEPAVATENVTALSVLSANLGDSLDLTVEARLGKKTSDRHAKIVRFQVEAGQSFAIVMRATGEALVDPYVALYQDAGGGHKLADSAEQRLLPMARLVDAVIVHTAEAEQELLLFAADHQLAASGSFQLDLIPLHGSAAVDWHARDHGQEVFAQLLREDEAELERFRGLGATLEQPTGLLEADITKVGLSERTSLRGFVERQNDQRTELFARLGNGNAELAASAGATLADLWAQARSQRHDLR